MNRAYVRFVEFLFFILISFQSFGIAVNSTGSGNWSNAGTWTPAAPTGADNITILSGHAVLLDIPFVLTTGTITVQTGATLTIANGPPSTWLTINNGAILNNQGTFSFSPFPRAVSVSGTFQNSGTINLATSAKLQFTSTGIYDHQYTTTAGTIPSATWNSSSTCLISGYTSNSTAPAGLNQNFGNFEWNCASQSANIDLAGALTTVNGNLNLYNTGFFGVYLAQNTTGYTLTVGGNFDCDNYFTVTTSDPNVTINIQGNMAMDNAFTYFVVSDGTGSVAFNITGDLTGDNGGFIDCSFFSGSGTHDFNIDGNVSFTNSSVLTDGGGSGTYNLNFSGSTLQTFVADNTSFSGNINFVIQSGASVDINNGNYFFSNGTFTLESNATIEIEDSNGIESSITQGIIRVPLSNRSYASDAILIYNGSSSQNMGNEPDIYTSDLNIEVNNASGVTMEDDLSIGSSQILDITSGALIIGANTLTINGDYDAGGSGSLTGSSNSNLAILGTGPLSGILTFTGSTQLNNFTLNRGGSGNTVVLGSNLSVSGTFDHLAGTLDFCGGNLTISSIYNSGGDLYCDGTSNLTINGSGSITNLAFASASALNSMTLNRSGATITTNATQYTVTNLNLTSGTLNNSSNTLQIGSNGVITRTGNGALGNIPGTSSNPYDIVYSGSVSSFTTGPELVPATSTLLNDFTNNSTSTITLNKNIRITGDATFSNGVINGSTFNITMQGSSWTVNSRTFNPASGTLIFNGNTTIGGTGNFDFNHLTLNASGTLTMPADNVNVSGDVLINAGGTFNANNGTVTLNGGSNQSFSGASENFNNITVDKSGGDVTLLSQVNLLGVLDIQSATQFDANGALTLISTSDGTSGNASIASLAGGGSVTGDVTIQRYISGEGRIWRYFASQISDGTVADWQDDFPITGTFDDADDLGGLNNPSLYYYDETISGVQQNGWIAYPSSGLASANPLTVGLGYSAFIREASNPTIWELTGTVNQGTIPLNPSYTDNGDPDEDGWNLLANPYPATIDWDALTRQRLDITVYVKDNGGGGIYRSWNGSTGNLPNGLIAAGQSFWVHANAASPVLTVEENDKSGSTGAFFRRAEEEPDPYLQITLSDGHYEDDTYVLFSATTTDGYDKGIDGLKLNNDIFDISTKLEDGRKLVFNFMSPASKRTNVDICVDDLEKDKNYVLNFSNIQSIDPDLDITLIDRYLQETINLREVTVYEFSISNDENSYGCERFKIVFRDLKLLTEVWNRRDVIAYPNPASDHITIRLKDQVPESLNTKITVFDIRNRKIMYQGKMEPRNKHMATKIDLTGWKKGLYLVRIQYGSDVEYTRFIKR